MSTSHILRSALGAVIVAAALVACGGGGGGSSPVPTAPAGTTPGTSTPTSAATATPIAPTPTPTNPGASSQTIVTSQGSVSGEQNMFTPAEGDTASGGQGPVNNTIDNSIQCEPTMSDNYHIHIYLGVYVNGQQMALPIAIGMDNPGAASAGFINSATCFYFIHTHDSSGIVHVEDTSPVESPPTGTVFTLQNVLDVWGITTDANHFGPFTGPVEVFTSGQVYRGDQNNQITPATDLTYWGQNAATVPLYSHEVIDVEVGPTYPTTLPNVQFYLEY